MGATLQIGFFVIIVSTVAALITGKPDPVLWGLMFFIGLTALSYALLTSSKRVIKRRI
jgi:hypothetical protein